MFLNLKLINKCARKYATSVVDLNTYNLIYINSIRLKYNKTKTIYETKNIYVRNIDV